MEGEEIQQFGYGGEKLTLFEKYIPLCTALPGMADMISTRKCE